MSEENLWQTLTVYLVSQEIKIKSLKYQTKKISVYFFYFA